MQQWAVARQEAQLRKRQEIEQSVSYAAVKGIATVMDKYFLDPIIGFFAPAVGDILSSALAIPSLYVSACKVGSVSLTLAIMYNVSIDMMFGTVPFMIGDIFDLINRSYVKNCRLIVGFVEGDAEIIANVRRKAFFYLLMTAAILYLTYLMFKFFAWMLNGLWSLLGCSS